MENVFLLQVFNNINKKVVHINDELMVTIIAFLY